MTHAFFSSIICCCSTFQTAVLGAVFTCQLPKRPPPTLPRTHTRTRTLQGVGAVWVV